MNLLLVLAEQTVAPARSGAPLRVLAAILLILIFSGIVYVIRHLTQVERTLKSDDLVPSERGARDNMIFIVCAVTLFAVGLLLFLLVKA